MDRGKQIKVCFFSGDITRSGGTERVGSVIANELVKDKKMAPTRLMNRHKVFSSIPNQVITQSIAI